MNMMKFKPFRDWVFIDIEERGIRTTAAGILLPDDDMKEFGIRPRWCRVLAIGEDFPDPNLSVGDRILVEHLGWSRSMMIDTKGGEPLKVWGTKLEKILLHEISE